MQHGNETRLPWNGMRPVIHQPEVLHKDLLHLGTGL